MYLVMQLFNLILRMWFWSSLLKDPAAEAAGRKGRAFYKSVFGFVFGEGDPEQGLGRGGAEIHHLLHPRPQGRDHPGRAHGAHRAGAWTSANALMNRLLLEYEGEPGVTDDGTRDLFLPRAHAHVGGRSSRSPARCRCSTRP